MPDLMMYFVDCVTDEAQDAARFVVATSPEEAVVLWRETILRDHGPDWVRESDENIASYFHGWGYDIEGEVEGTELRVFQVPPVTGAPRVLDYWREVPCVATSVAPFTQVEVC